MQENHVKPNLKVKLGFSRISGCQKSDPKKADRRLARKDVMALMIFRTCAFVFQDIGVDGRSPRHSLGSNSSNLSSPPSPLVRAGAGGEANSGLVRHFFSSIALFHCFGYTLAEDRMVVFILKLVNIHCFSKAWVSQLNASR